MAWTWSAPRRGTVAGVAALSGGHRVLHRAILSLGRGDAARGLSISFAAFLTLAGTAAPNLPTPVLTAILFLSGAALVCFAAIAPSTSSVRLSVPLPDTAAAVTPKTSRLSTAHCIQELLTPQKAASAADRAAFARLTAHMSHELRTPLNAILGFSEMMSNEVFGPLGSTCYAAYARDIHASGISLLKSAEDALAITTLLTSPVHNHCAVSAHAASAATEALAFHANGLMARGITARCTIDDDADIVADPQASRQLLINLIAAVTERAAPGATLLIASRTCGAQIEILLTVAGSIAPVIAGSQNFSMLLARTLAELSGATIVTDPDNSETTGEWQIAMHVARVTQNDFFSACRRAA